MRPHLVCVCCLISQQCVLFFDAIWIMPFLGVVCDHAPVWGVVVFSWFMPCLWVGCVLGFAFCLWILLAAVVVVGGFCFCGEFDPGSGRTLAACLTHASRTDRMFSDVWLVANG